MRRIKLGVLEPAEAEAAERMRNGNPTGEKTPQPTSAQGSRRAA